MSDPYSYIMDMVESIIDIPGVREALTEYLDQSPPPSKETLDTAKQSLLDIVNGIS